MDMKADVATTQDWLEASKGFVIFAYFGVDASTTIYSTHEAEATLVQDNDKIVEPNNAASNS